MDSATLKKFRELLETQRDALLQTHGRHEQDLRHHRTSEDTAGPDFAADLEEEVIESRVVDSEERLLEKIVHALERIDNGSYGTCEGCEQPIPLARLEAKPSVSLCVDCQEAKDSGLS